MITLRKLTDAAPTPDEAYLMHIGHLRTCAWCTDRTGGDCPKGKVLRRAVVTARSMARRPR